MKNIILCIMFLCGCVETSSNNIYTFYRNSPIDNNMRIHIATFDSRDGGTSIPFYNKDNCEQARELYSAQPGVISKFWCEKGKFKK